MFASSSATSTFMIAASQDQLKPRASFARDQHQIATVQTSEIPSDREPNSRSGHSVGQLVADPIKRLEDPLLMFVRYARAPVADRDRRFSFGLFGGDVHCAAVRRIFFHIADQIGDDLADRISVH